MKPVFEKCIGSRTNLFKAITYSSELYEGLNEGVFQLVNVTASGSESLISEITVKNINTSQSKMIIYTKNLSQIEAWSNKFRRWAEATSEECL